MFSISDRLKAAVNQIEATGTSLSARAVGQNQASAHGVQGSPSSAGQAGAASPASILSPTSPSSPALATATGSSQIPQVPTPTSEKPPAPTSAGTNGSVGPASPRSTGQLAEGALSGLRKSFNFSRPSLDAPRPSTPTIKELKDIPTSPLPGGGGEKKKSSVDIPSAHLGTPSAGSIARAKSPLHRTIHTPELPTPNPEDPATYPLPPSPLLSPSPLIIATGGMADPLGVSPLLPPVDQADTDTSADVGDIKDIEEVLQVDEPEETQVQAKEAEAEAEEEDDTSKRKGKGTRQESTDSAILATGPPKLNLDGDVETQLATAERRFEDLSQRFTTLLAQKHNADKVLKALTPLEGGIADHEALEGWVRMVNGKIEMITEEMKRLQGKLTLQESRIEELRDTHRLEGSSQHELISKLRAQLATAETNLASKATDLAATSSLKADLAKAQTTAKEEEEKRTKAIQLLKTVRMKLVKLEKEKEQIERDRAEERAERSSAKDEVERVKAEKEREVNNLRKGFERELAGAKERHEKELQAKKAAWELEMITTKASHAKELSAKTTKVTGLEAIVKELSSTNQTHFQEIQSRQAEVESGRSELETLRNRTKELEYQLREAEERAAVLEETSLPGSRRGNELSVPSLSRSSTPAGSRRNSASDVQRLLADAEARAEVKISDLRNKIRSLESERNDAEEEWATKLGERVREVEKLRRGIAEKESEYAESLRTRRDKERLVDEAHEAKRSVEREMKVLAGQVEEAKESIGVAAEAERVAREELAAARTEIEDLKAQLEDARNHSQTLKANNRTLRDELRKVQSSVQLLEKSRNPGVGYWSTGARGADAEPRKSLESSRTGGTGGSGGTVPPAPAGQPAAAVAENGSKEEEEVNLEYLRNVILQFLEHKEMRPNLVRVLSVILRFTPQELRRLNAGVMA